MKPKHLLIGSIGTFVAAALLYSTTSGSTTTVDQLVKTLEQQEGFRSHPYKDTRGFLTIGYGTNLSRGIDTQAGALLLRYTLTRKEEELARRWPPYLQQSPEVQAALLDAGYQLGITGLLGFHQMLNAVENGDWPEAVKQARLSHWDHETPSRVERVVSVFESQ